MRVVWHAVAIADLTSIETFIARGNPAAARRMEQRIKTAVARLEQQPHLGRPGRVPRTRELVVGGTPYIAAYTVSADALTILSVLHGAQNWPEALPGFD